MKLDEVSWLFSKVLRNNHFGRMGAAALWTIEVMISFPFGIGHA